MNHESLAAFWSNRYNENMTGWDIGSPSTPLVEYFDQLEDKTLKILIPGAGNAYEAEYLWQQGFVNVHVLDIAPQPLAALQKRVPDFPAAQLIQANFFEHQAAYDLIVEQTFFCSFEPSKSNRLAYAQKIAELLTPSGKLVGLWFNHPLFEGAKRPFGGTKEEYLSYFTPHFETQNFEESYNSIPPRQGRELFGIFVRK
ncbi:MAG: methyltransferase domain-containing protein [Bacteroidota bacterium]